MTKKYSSKKKSKQNRKNKSRKQRQTLKKGGGCGCNSNLNGMKGGGDFFNGGNVHPASFNNVPIHSFYPYNNYTAGSDVQRAQIDSRLIPIKGGKRKSKKGGKSKKMKEKKGGNIGNMSSSFISSFSDPLVSGSKIISTQFGNTSGSLQSVNTIKGILT